MALVLPVCLSRPFWSLSHLPGGSRTLPSDPWLDLRFDRLPDCPDLTIAEYERGGTRLPLLVLRVVMGALQRGKDKGEHCYQDHEPISTRCLLDDEVDILSQLWIRSGEILGGLAGLARLAHQAPQPGDLRKREVRIANESHDPIDVDVIRAADDASLCSTFGTGP